MQWKLTKYEIMQIKWRRIEKQWNKWGDSKMQLMAGKTCYLEDKIISIKARARYLTFYLKSLIIPRNEKELSSWTVSPWTRNHILTLKAQGEPVFPGFPVWNPIYWNQRKNGARERSKGKVGRAALRIFVTVGPALTHPCYHYELRYHATPVFVPLRISRAVTYYNDWL